MGPIVLLSESHYLIALKVNFYFLFFFIFFTYFKKKFNFNEKFLAGNFDFI